MKIFKKKVFPEKKVEYYKIEINYNTYLPSLTEKVDLKKDIYKNISKKLFCINIEYHGVNTTMYSYLLLKDKKNLEKIKNKIYEEMIDSIFERTEQFKKFRVIRDRKNKLNRINSV